MNIKEIYKLLKFYDENLSVCYSNSTDKFYVSSYIEVMEYCILRSGTEHEDTPNDAIIKYYNSLLGKKLVVGARTKNRKEFRLPNIIVG